MLRGRVEFVDVVAHHGPTRAVDRVSVAFAAGEKVAVCGSNGSGKTTLVRSLLGLHRLTHGEARVDGLHPRTSTEWRTRRLDVAYVPQRPATGRFPLLVGELLASAGHEPTALEAAEDLGIGHLLRRPVHALSGGQLQRVVIARGIAATRHRATVLVADEPTSALDFAGQDEVAELLTTLAATVLVVTHSTSLIERCDRVVEMASGELRQVR